MLTSNLDFICTCPLTTTGLVCETILSACQANPNICQNGGRCIDIVDGSGVPVSYNCSCTSNFTGSNCQTQGFNLNIHDFLLLKNNVFHIYK